ncbi:hypothetical protein [Legionella hackeliae]|uniref:hypothetical protein n=1 Tax=Legionella hackeliae TaxID=449 RepID=UPI00073B89F6|nr:hypothetical protein [Legionella hackeliae]KTD09653.1 hypothetical protein Lhac_2021 [Legionella hackeliae]STX47774.1 Uncharacterised protein [Legionella hackeliae]
MKLSRLNAWRFSPEKGNLEQIDILAATDEPSVVINKFTQFREVVDILLQTPNQVSVNVWSGIKVNLFLVAL